MSDKLTDNEKQVLAREVAADKYDSECFGAEVARSAFIAGWDAAMEYVNARKVQQPSDTN